MSENEKYKRGEVISFIRLICVAEGELPNARKLILHEELCDIHKLAHSPQKKLVSQPITLAYQPSHLHPPQPNVSS